jgi:hypothetical protein
MMFKKLVGTPPSKYRADCVPRSTSWKFVAGQECLRTKLIYLSPQQLWLETRCDGFRMVGNTELPVPVPAPSLRLSVRLVRKAAKAGARLRAPVATARSMAEAATAASMEVAENARRQMGVNGEWPPESIATLHHLAARTEPTAGRPQAWKI